MKKYYILYICINDGSEMRINKEINTFSKKCDVIFLGIGVKSATSFALNNCKYVYLIKGNHKSPITIIRLLFRLLFILFKYQFKYVHVVDEQLYFFLFPLLLKKNVTLEIFDSIFLKINKSNEDLFIIKKVLYSCVIRIIVTDENRFKLLPNFAIKKAIIIPNVPITNIYDQKISNEKFLTICYFGSLVKNRGSEFAYNLVCNNKVIRVLMSGWIRDSYTQKLLQHPQIEYLGIMNQTETNSILAKYGDYLLCFYPSNNLNNINASPNKIYDSIHTKTPVIINHDIIVSEFVCKINTGYIVNINEETNYIELAKELVEKKNSYSFTDGLIAEFCWENYEEQLLNLHN